MKLIIYAGILLTGLVQCQQPRIALSDAALNQKEYAVAGRKGLFTKEKMSFANYRTTTVKRSWTKGSSARNGWYGLQPDGSIDNIISTEYMKKKQTVRFQLTDDAGNESEVSCVANFNSKDLQLGNRPNNIVNIATEILFNTDRSESNYYAQLYTNKNPKPWELIIDNKAWQGMPKNYSGLVAMDKDNYYKLVPVTTMQNKNGKPASILFGSVGMEIRNKNDVPVAAIGLFNKGVVYLADVDAEEKLLLASICAALLMQEQLG